MVKFPTTLLSLALVPASALAQGTDWATSPPYTWLFEDELTIPPVKTPKVIDGVHYYELVINKFEEQLYKDDRGPTSFVGYDGMFPGPTIKQKKGVNSVVRTINNSTEPASLHLHGSYSRAPFDGWAEDLIETDQFKDYYYPNGQSARTIWYHDHAMNHSAENNYFGQIGQYHIVDEEVESALNIPCGDEFDVPLTVTTHQFNDDGSLWSPDANNERISVYGDVVFVNGRPWPKMTVKPRRYRFRLLDAAVSRSFLLYLEEEGGEAADEAETETETETETEAEVVERREANVTVVAECGINNQTYYHGSGTGHRDGLWKSTKPGGGGNGSGDHGGNGGSYGSDGSNSGHGSGDNGGSSGGCGGGDGSSGHGSGDNGGSSGGGGGGDGSSGNGGSDGGGDGDSPASPFVGRIPFTVIASDSGFLSAPVEVTELFLSSAERYEVIIDFSAFAGKNLTLRNEVGFANDVDYLHTDKVMQFHVEDSDSDVHGTDNEAALPDSLVEIDYPRPAGDKEGDGIDRTFTFDAIRGVAWIINGVTFDDVENRVLAKPARGAVETWVLVNENPNWSHPIHVHLVDFRILSRTGTDRPVYEYESGGLKDTVWLAAGETVVVEAVFSPWEGVYMFHCHNLVHEDHAMMAAFNATLIEGFGYEEKMHFVDPLDPAFAPEDCDIAADLPSRTGPFADSEIELAIEGLEETEAYKDIGAVESALAEYWTGSAKREVVKSAKFRL